MKKSTAAILTAFVALALVGVVLAFQLVGGVEDSSSNVTSQSDQLAGELSGTNQSDTKNETQTGNIAVEIKNFAFAPEVIKIKSGTTVTWTNQDSVRHDVVPDEETADFKASDLLGKGQSYSVTFKTPGVYSYFCSPHPYMKALVEVVE